jgi:hypothetical protein
MQNKKRPRNTLACNIMEYTHASSTYSQFKLIVDSS